MKEFKGRIVASGTVTAKALVSHGGLNTLASFQKALQFGDKKATCGDQNNPDLYGKQMKVYFLYFLRPEQRFESLDALKAQMAYDKKRAEELL